jgi:carbamoyltransferase
MNGSSVVAGFGGVHRNACAAVCTADRILGICEQERITRVAAAGFNETGLPDEALDTVLLRAGRRRADITMFALAEASPAIDGNEPVRLDHHFGHACAAFLPSRFERAVIDICDHEAPHISVWEGRGTDITRLEHAWHGPGFSNLYSECAEALGFRTRGREQRMEALARLEAGGGDERATRLFALVADRIEFRSDWHAQVAGWLRSSSDPASASAIAQALQRRIGDLLVEFMADVRRRAPGVPLCIGGSLFFNSHLNSRVKLEAGFDAVFVPVNPGNAGLSVGAALYAAGPTRQAVIPFSGPSYSGEEIKATLDNCKLTYQWASESETIAIAVEELKKGRLVAWFDGGMEWGARALGGRSILANPFAPYVLDNLNRFLKQREAWRGYALSGLTEGVREAFDGPPDSPYMECDYVPKNRERFRHILPGPNAALRVHTVGADGPPRFRALLQHFGVATGCPIVVNTSFNGFREPMVCSPRDAIRVFFGTGLDVLILGEFVLTK